MDKYTRKIMIPKYALGQEVKFEFNGEFLIGEIEIIDAQGTFFQKDEPSYDILDIHLNTLFKHVKESLIVSGSMIETGKLE